MSACFAYKSTIIIRIRQSTIRQQSGVNFWYAQKGWRKSNFSENMIPETTRNDPYPPFCFAIFKTLDPVAPMGPWRQKF